MGFDLLFGTVELLRSANIAGLMSHYDLLHPQRLTGWECDGLYYWMVPAGYL